MLTKTLLAVVVALAEMNSALASDGLYQKGSPVLQITNKKQLDKLINTSNHTSIVEFYAPWCGHCKSLKGDYEKAAHSLASMVNVAAINCDETRELCSSMGVKGFPTLKIVRPSKVPGRKPVIEDYQGQRTAGSIVDSLTSQMNNHVVKVTDATLGPFLEANNGPKALLFTEKATTAPITKALATDFLGVLSLGQVRSKEKATVDKYGVAKFPALVLLPGDDKEPVVYDGKMKHKEMLQFLSQAAEPNKPVDINAAAPPKKSKADKEKKTAATTTSSTPTEKQTAPVIIQGAVPIPTVHTLDKLRSSCLGDKSPTCVLAFVGDEANEKQKATQDVLGHLAELAHKNAQAKRAAFPFYAVPASNEASTLLLEALELDAESKDQVHLVAINARRGWWRHYKGGDSPSFATIESWIDAIRMGEGAKEKLPQSLVTKAEVKEAKEEPREEPEKQVKEQSNDEPVDGEEIKHEEL
ncbi:hypothetical protein SEPCBS57363_005239 [Sporothrix epigloea]|uniref:protein disulfide-isomerase n=1 Tax=Sporothrix epigloea TaxID=1892477 RepID=A0ABP0DXN0_9PEZI